MILENITYTVVLPGNEWSEAEFIAEVLERADCGLLLDVTNVFANSINHGYDARYFLRQLPLDRVVQLHFVGGKWEGGMFIDSHSHPTPSAVWALMKEVLACTPVRGAILERDENLPGWESLGAELERARQLGREFHRWN